MIPGWRSGEAVSAASRFLIPEPIQGSIREGDSGTVTTLDQDTFSAFVSGGGQVMKGSSAFGVEVRLQMNEVFNVVLLDSYLVEQPYKWDECGSPQGAWDNCAPEDGSWEECSVPSNDWSDC